MRRYVDEVVDRLLDPLINQSPKAPWKLLGWDAEQGISVTLQKGDAVVLVEFEPYDQEKKCFARTEQFNVAARRPFEPGKNLTADDRAAVDALAGMVRRREGDLPRPERPTTARSRSVREIQVDRLLVPEGRGHYYINPYVGCMIGCPFCYVAERADMSRALEGLPAMEWGRYVDVKVNAAEVLRREVGEHPPGIVRLSPIVTDPYQAIERNYRVTRGCLEVLRDAGFRVMILTRAARITDDLELIRSMAGAVVGFSIPTDDDGYRRIFEPGADPVDDRIRALSEFHAAGVPTVAVIQPLLPMNAERLVERVAPIVRAVRIDRMYSMHLVEHLYREHGLAGAAGDAFFEEHLQKLKEAFSARGVIIDEMDDLGSLLDSIQE